MFKFNYTLEEKDYLQFAKYHYKNAPSQKRTAFVVRLLAAFLLLASIASAVLSGGFNSTAHILGIILSGVILLGWDLIMRSAVKSQIKSMKRDGKAPYGEASQVYFSEDDVHSVSESTETRAKYANLGRICDDGNAVYIYINAIQAFVLPYRAFESEAQKAEFLTFISGKVQKQ